MQTIEKALCFNGDDDGSGGGGESMFDDYEHNDDDLPLVWRSHEHHGCRRSSEKPIRYIS